MVNKKQIALLGAGVLAMAVAANAQAKAPRTGLYGSVMQGNASADFTTADYVKFLNLVGDQQWVAGFGGANLQNASTAFKASGFTWLADVTGGGAPNDVKVGLTNGQFGAGISIALAKTSNETGTPSATTSTTSAGNGYGLFGSFGLPNGNVYGGLSWETVGGNTVIVDGTPSTEDAYGQISINGGFAKFGSNQGDLSYDAGGALNLWSHINDAPEPDFEESSMSLLISGNLGYLAQASEGQAVVLGVVPEFAYMSYTLPGDVDPSQMKLSIRPNVGFQKTIGKGFEVQLGAGHTFVWASNSDHLAAVALTATGVDKAKGSLLQTTDGDVMVGLRWTQENFSIEGQVAEALLTDGPNVIGGKAPGLFAQVGVALGF